MAYELHEKCAVVGIFLRRGNDQAAPLAYEGLFAMQHRGTEASGIVTEANDGSLRVRRGLGMVVDVYQAEDMAYLQGKIAIGHNRYSTSGAKDCHAQPVVDAPIGLALSVNGNLPSTHKLETFLAKHGIKTAGMNDVEMMGFAVGHYIRAGLTLPMAIAKAYPLFTGAFSAIALHDGCLVAFRDRCGIRPLALGTLPEGLALASETCGLDIVGAKYLREVEPGEMLVINRNGLASTTLAKGDYKLDIFEFVYFARHDSYLYGQSVNEVRRRFGEQLAREHPPASAAKNTIVVPVPDTSIPAAEGYADLLGLRHVQAIIKNRYIGRTFMQPTHNDRRRQLRRKHNVVPDAVKGRDVILVDDSIVRLNTMPRLVELMHESGALSVNVLVASPPVRFPDFYGIDTPDQCDLAAANMTIAEIQHRLSSGGKKDTRLGYLSLDGMIAATGLPKSMFNLSCFTGEYPIGIGERAAEIHAPVSMEGI